jgi:nucleoside-diphosphate-sugar epimerase
MANDSERWSSSEVICHTVAGSLVGGHMTMHIFLAGATGAIGRSLVPKLIERGYTVTGTTRSRAKADALRAMGATPVVVDGLDRDGIIAAVRDARPDAIVHEMTALAGMSDIRHIEREFETTNRLRAEGTDNLLAAAQAAGVERFVAQSYAGWPYERTGGPVKTEDDPLDPDPPAQLRGTLEAIRHVENAVTARGGVVLRYGGFYGPGTGIAPGGDQWRTVEGRKFPVVGDGGGVWSFVHIDDAATATIAALEHWTPGEVYNIVDDEPAPVREWLPALASIVGARPPRHVPRFVGRLMGEHVVAMMCDIRGASNAKARALLDWRPAWPSWRQGFAALSDA